MNKTGWYSSYIILLEFQSLLTLDILSLLELFIFGEILA